MDENEVRKKMNQVLNLVSSDISSIRTSRATPSLVEDLIIPAYGGQQKLKLVELATISTSDERTIVIEPWDKSIIGEIRQGILAANIGLNPVISENIIRINLPPLTSEDREKYVKLLSQKLESGKVMIRQVRAEAIRGIRTEFEAKKLSEDEKFESEKHLQEITDEFSEKLEEIGEAKRKEIIQV